MGELAHVPTATVVVSHVYLDNGRKEVGENDEEDGCSSPHSFETPTQESNMTRFCYIAWIGDEEPMKPSKHAQGKEMASYGHCFDEIDVCVACTSSL